MAAPLNGSSVLVLLRTAGTLYSGEAFGTGDGTTTSFAHTMVNPPVLLGSVTITAGSVVATDDGLGNLVGNGIASGSIDYDTGAASITYETPPASGTSITASYTQAVYTAVGSQRDATFDEKTNAVDVSAKDQRQAQYLPGKYSASITMSHLYVPSDAAFSALKSAMRSGSKIVVARQESGTETEHASAVITELSGNFKDQTEGVVSLTIAVDGPWVVS